MMDVFALYRGVSGMTVLHAVQNVVPDYNGDYAVNMVDVSAMYAVSSGR